MNHKPFEILKEQLVLAGWNVPESTYACLSDYEKIFLENEFTGINTIEYYQARLQALGFNDHAKVLDVGCGMGQWSLALSKLNHQVTGADINIGRLLVAKEIASVMSINNVEFVFSGAERSPFRDQAYDAVFCYGVFMFTHMPSALAEFYRVLNPGGRLYLNVNSLGWYLHLLIDRGWKKRDLAMIKTSALMMLKAWLGKKQNVMISPERLKEMLDHAGFKDVNMGPESTITENETRIMCNSKYPSAFYGQPAVTEVLCFKKNK